MKKRCLAALMTIIMCFTTLLPADISIRAEETDVNADSLSMNENIITGTIGDNNGFQWTYNENTKTLTVTGEDSGLGEAGGLSPFYDLCRSVEHVILKDCKLVGNVCYLFGMLSRIESIQFLNCDTSELTDMAYMFYNCKSLKNVDFGSMDTSKVWDMGGMFCGCESLESIDLSNFDTSSVTSTRLMFGYCNSLKNINLSSFDASKMTDIRSMFKECTSIEDLDLSNFKTSSAIYMDGIFQGCTTLKSVNISGFDTRSSDNRHLIQIFENCTSLKTIYTPKFMGTEHTINLPTTFYDTQMSGVTKLTADNCNTCLSIDATFDDKEDDGEDNNDENNDDNNSSIVNKYQYFEGGISWYDAQAKCEELGGHLLVISSAEEQAYINSYVEELRQAGKLTKQNIWLGATISNGVLNWLKDEGSTYTNWASGEPNNVFSMQDCVMMYTSLSVNGNLGYWNDENGNGRNWEGFTLKDTGYICEWETYNDYPSLSEESALLFIRFLMNSSQLTDDVIKNSAWYQILTNSYTGEDKEIQARALVIYTISAIDKMAEKADDNSNYLNKQLVSYLEKEVGKHSNLDAEIINEYQNSASKNLTKAIYNTITNFFPTSADNIFNITDMYDAYSGVMGSVEKGKVLAERITAGVEVVFLILEYEKAGRYSYFSSYLSNRGSYESADDEIFKVVMNYNRMAASDNSWLANLINVFIPWKDSFNNHFDLLDEWAENIYQLSCAVNQEYSETKSTVVTDDNFTYDIFESSAKITSFDSNISGDIILPNKVNEQSITQIESNAFENCTLLESVKLGDQVEKVGNNAFKGCISMQSIVIPASVQEIGSLAFEDCVSLQSVVISNTITNIGEDVFKNCNENLEIICNCNNTYMINYCKNQNLNCTIIHNFNEYISDKNSTCTELGTMTATCTECEAIDTMDDLVLQEHLWDKGVITKYPTINEEGVCVYTCKACGETQTDIISKLLELKFSGASLTLHDNLTINYRVNKNLFEELGYEHPYVKFVFNGTERIVSDYRVVDDKYVFDFDDIAPNQMNDIIYATLYAEYDGVEFTSETREYSVATYCYSMLEKYGADEYSKFRTLLVDLLNYGEASQIYTDYNVNHLVTNNLTDNQKVWGTSDTPTFTSVMNNEHEIIDNPTVIWKGAGLNLQDSVTMRFRISAESVEGLSVKINTESKTWVMPDSEFKATEGGYYIYFDKLNAAQMSEPVYITIYDGETPVSNTVCYSIESYAYSKQNDMDEKLVNLVNAMMKYGNSAYSYIN